MKKTVSRILLCVLLVSCLFALSACGAPKLSGSYQADAVAVKATYAFESNGKLTLTLDPLIGSNVSWTGTYEINEDTSEITITLNADDADAKKYSGTHSFAQGQENDVEYIKIAGVKYTKLG